MMTKYEIKRRIFVSGNTPEFQVHHNLPGEACVIHVPRIDIANRIVRTLRERALSSRPARRARGE